MELPRLPRLRAPATPARLALWLSLLSALCAADAPPKSAPPATATESAAADRVEVQASRLRPYSVVAVTSGATQHLVLRRGNVGSPSLTLLIGDAQEGDEIISIDGEDVVKMKSWSSRLRGKSTLELRRFTTKTAYIIVTTTSHQSPPGVSPPRAGDGQGPLSGRR